MKTKSMIVVIALIISFLGCNAQNEKKEVDFPELKGHYLGQKPPGMIPKLFAPDILKPQSGKNGVHSSPSFSTDGTEMYFTVMPEEGPFLIKYMKMAGSEWTEPIIAPFTIEQESNNSIFYNSDDILLFKSKSDRHENPVSTLWKVERKNSELGVPYELSSVFDGLGMGVSVSKSGSIYFTVFESGTFNIYKSELINGKYSERIALSKEINASDCANWQPFIASDESYLIFGRYVGEPKKGISNLFISYKNQDGTWTEAMNMGKTINETNAMWPYVSPDGKYLFFVSNKNNINDEESMVWQVYWMDAGVIDDLRSKNNLETGAYMGLKLPGEVPEQFPEKKYYRFFNEGKECYFIENGIWYTKLEDDKWIDPINTNINYGDYADFEMNISPDGEKIFFNSIDRPVPQGTKIKNCQTWIVERQEKAWSKPNFSNVGGMYVTSTLLSGTIYFTNTEERKNFIAKSNFVKGRFQPDEQLPEPIFSKFESDSHPCVAPDESYIIFDSDTRERINNCPLFISFKQSDNTWTNPINMGKYIQQHGAAMAKVTLDGKLIFYHDSKGVVWWVGAKIIEELKPQSLK